ncbi:MAG TPA: AAA family ATPase, partial [Thermoanaerobaculia bacterium]
MIQRLSVSNYRSLGEKVEVHFGAFTALVGPNGAGKSNVVDALRFVSDAMHMGLSGAITHRNGIDAVRRWSGGHPFNSAIHLDLILESGRPASYSFELRGDSAEEYKVKLEEAWVRNGNDEVRFRIENGQWAVGPPGLKPP